eukprot:6207310-Pleurochrysis_carterae.AAC.1
MDAGGRNQFSARARACARSLFDHGDDAQADSGTSGESGRGGAHCEATRGGGQAPRVSAGDDVAEELPWYAMAQTKRGD